MKNSTFKMLLSGLLAVAGCAHEKTFDVSGVVPSGEVRREAAPARPPDAPRESTRVMRRPERKEVRAPQRDSRPELAFKTTSQEPQDSRSARVSFPVAPRSGPAQVTLVPDNGLVGKVAGVNVGLHFVVLNFPIGRMAAVGKTMVMYRNGQRIGEVKITGPQQDDNIVADVLSGEAQAGDEVREQ